MQPACTWRNGPGDEQGGAVALHSQSERLHRRNWDEKLSYVGEDQARRRRKGISGVGTKPRRRDVSTSCTSEDVIRRVWGGSCSDDGLLGSQRKSSRRRWLHDWHPGGTPNGWNSPGDGSRKAGRWICCGSLNGLERTRAHADHLRHGLLHKSRAQSRCDCSSAPGLAI